MTTYECPHCHTVVRALGGTVVHLCLKNRDKSNRPKETRLEPR